MKIPVFRGLVLLLITFTISGCRYFTTNNVSEGVIEYEISYPGAEKDNFMAGLLPSEMKLSFKNNNTAAELNAGMGMFSTCYVTNTDKKELIHLLKVMNKKFAVVRNKKDVEEFIKSHPKMTFEFSKETKIVAGYKCKKAIVTIPDKKKVITVWYTNDIGIKNSNWTTPYREIDGVLMEYEVEQYNIAMKFTAKHVSDIAVEDTLFSLPGDYQKISKKEMDEMFLNFN